MPGLFNRLKVWEGLEVIQNNDLNAEFTNIIQNLGPSGMSGWSASIAQMQIQTNPGTPGLESLATTTSGEIERLRYQINAIIGGPDNLWYDIPALSLSEVTNLLPNSPPTNRIVSGVVGGTSKQPQHLLAAGSANTITLQASPTTPFVVFINGTQYSFTSNITLSSLNQPPVTQNTFAINDSNADLSTKTNNFGAYIADFNPLADGTSRLLRDYDLVGNTVGTAITSLAGTFQAFSYTHSANTEYFIGYIKPGAGSTSVLVNKCWRGCFFDSSSNPIKQIPLNNTEAVTLMQLVWVYVTTAGTLQAVYTHPRYSAVQPATFSAGDMWYDLVNQEWKQSNGSTYSVANVMLVGMCLTNGTNCVAARSFDWYKGYSNTSNIVMDWVSTTEYRTKYDTNYANLYGVNTYFDKDQVRWLTTNKVSGLSFTNSNTYYLYLSENGTSFIDQYAPLKRPDLGGHYHPSQSWRCFGLFFYNGSGNFDQFLFAPLSLASGEVIDDKSISISKRKAAYPVLTDENATVPLTTPVDGFGTSTSIVITNGVSPTLVTLVDTNSKTVTVSINTSGRPVICGLTSSSGGQIGAISSTNTTFSPLITIAILMDGNVVYQSGFGAPNPNILGNECWTPASTFWSIVPKVTPGNHVFTCQYSINTTSSSVQISNVSLFAFEI
jgi:hypothetical protein